MRVAKRFRAAPRQAVDIGEAANLIADKTHGLAWLFSLSQLNIMLVSNAEIVPDHVALLDVEREHRQIVAR